MSVLLYATETWTLLSCDEKTLEALHVQCQRQILHIHWSQHITKGDVSSRTGLPHQTTSFVSIRPQSSAHSEGSCTWRPSPSSRSVIRSFTWSWLETSTWSSSCSLTDQLRHDMVWFLPDWSCTGGHGGTTQRPELAVMTTAATDAAVRIPAVVRRPHSVVTCKIKHLQKCFRAVDFPRLCRRLKMLKNVLFYV